VGPILVVDDSETVRQHVRECLEHAGFAVIEASDGVEGLEVVESTPDLSLVMLDVNMPRMGGLDMLERMQQQNRTPPVLVLTSEAQPALIERAKAAGAKGWLVKPVKPDLLVAAIGKVTKSAAGGGK